MDLSPDLQNREMNSCSRRVSVDGSKQGNTLLHGVVPQRSNLGEALAVQYVQPPTAAPEWARWLEEIGFIVGERVMLMARGLPGGDPLVVRVAQSTFALRRAEAACIGVTPVDQTDTQEIVA
jgi:ferrous iron transport protein A